MGEEYFDPSDVEQNKTIILVAAILQLFLPILFFLPLVACGGSSYGKFYSNQGLLLLILDVAAGLIGYIPLVGGICKWIVGVIALVLGIINAVNAGKGVRKGMPIIGGIELIKS